MASLVWPFDLAPALKISKVILDCSVCFLQHLGNRASGNLVSNQGEHGISKHINRGLVSGSAVKFFQFLAGVAVGKDALGFYLAGCKGFIH